MAKRSDKRTFTKRAVRVILVVALIDLQLSYVLAFLGREQIAETLSITVVTEIVAVMLGYFMKAYSETKEEKKHELRAKRVDAQEDDVDK